MTKLLVKIANGFRGSRAKKTNKILLALFLELRPNSYAVPVPCCRAEPNPIFCIQAKNNRMYLVRHGSSSATA